jgi:hypothetical protein
MRTSSCRWVRRRLPLLAGDDLPGLDRRLAERHLIGCADCRRELEGLRGALGVLHAAAGGEPAGAAAAAPAPDLWPALERQIREARRPARLFPVPQWAWAAAAAAVLALVTAAAGVAMGPRSGLDPRVALRTLLVSQPAPAPKPTPPSQPAARRPRPRVADLMERGEWARSDEVDRKIRQAATTPTDRRAAPRLTAQ